MRVLITGASGLLGQSVARRAVERGDDVVSVFWNHPVSLGRAFSIDLTKKDSIYESIREVRPEAVVHTAAYTSVDGCEQHKNRAWSVNVEATKHLAIASSDAGAQLVFVSTDYVFDGKKGNYSEVDETNPVNYYGYTKLKGEELVREHSATWCVVRTSVVYGWAGPKPDFAAWIMDNLRNGNRLKVLVDQCVSPTLNTNLADILLEIVESKKTGIFHAAGATALSRYEFAMKIAEVFDLDSSLITPATMAEMNWRANRPRDSSLNVTRVRRTLNTKPLDIADALGILRQRAGQEPSEPAMTLGE